MAASHGADHGQADPPHVALVCFAVARQLGCEGLAWKRCPRAHCVFMDDVTTGKTTTGAWQPGSTAQCSEQDV